MPGVLPLSHQQLRIVSCTWGGRGRCSHATKLAHLLTQNTCCGRIFVYFCVFYSTSCTLLCRFFAVDMAKTATVILGYDWSPVVQ